MTIITESSEITINICSSIIHKKISVFKANAPMITFGIFKQREFLGIGDIKLSPEIQWVALRASNQKIPRKKSIIESFKLKIRCCYTKDIKRNNNNNSIKNLLRNKSNNVPLIHSHSIDSKHKKANSLNVNTSTPNNKKSNKVTSFPLSSNTATKSHKNVMSAYKDKKIYQNTSQLCHNDSYQNSIGLPGSGRQNKSEKKIIYKKRKGSNVTDTAQYQTTNQFVGNSTKLLPSALLSTLEQKELEEHIIDKSYENGIKNDEMIDDETTKSWISCNCQNDENYLCLFSEENDEKMTKFNEMKEDYELMYSDDYMNNIDDNMLKLEIELVIEKSLELQKGFYDAYKESKLKNDKMSNIVKTYYKKIRKIQKMRYKMEKENERIKYINDKKAIQGEISFIKKDVTIWSNFFKVMNREKDTKDEMKEKIKKKILMTIMKILIKNRMITDSMSSEQRNKLRSLLKEQINSNEKSNISLKSSLISEPINSLKMKLLPLISENNKDSKITHTTPIKKKTKAAIKKQTKYD